MAACRLCSVYGAALEKQLIYDLCFKCRAAMVREDRELALFGTPHGFKFNGQPRAGDPTSLIASIKLNTVLGFHPRLPLAQGIERVVASFRASEQAI